MPVAETLGVVGSVIAIVQISTKIISCCQFYIEMIDGAPSDLRVILIEVSALKGIAKSLQYLTQPKVATSALSNQLDAVRGPIEGCKKALEELEALLPRAAISVRQRLLRRKLDAAAATLAWPLKSGKAKKLLQEIMQHKSTINLALTAEFVHDLKDVKQKTEKIQITLDASERYKIYRWLETTNPSDIHNRSQRLYEPPTGSWMLRTPEWPLWIEGKHRCLWIHGIPGAGKSILASYLAEKIRRHCKHSSSESSRFGHAYYYCYFGHNQDESSHFLRWIIGQLCRQSTKVPEELQDIYNSAKTPNLSSLLSILHSSLEGYERVYIVLDAVDESMPRADLLRIIRDLSTDDRFSSLGLIVTSREYIDIEQVLEDVSIRISMSNPFVEEDIATLVNSAVQSDARYQRWPEDLRREMQDTIPKTAKGMFRWAVCQLDILKRLRPDVSVIRAALSNLPKTLDETYERIFLAIPEEDWLSVQHVFHWMVYHKDLFNTNIPVSILLQAVQQSTANLLSPDSDQLHDFQGLRERCGCLIMVEQEEWLLSTATRFPQRSTISFAHYTVKEYLESSRISQKKFRFFTLAQERIQKEFAGIAFCQALTIQPSRLAEYGDHEWHEAVQEAESSMTANFEHYCGLSSVLQLGKWAEHISSDSILMELSEALLNPHRTAYESLVSLLSFIPVDVFGDTYSGLGIIYLFWELTWTSKPNPSSAIFLNLLLTSHKRTPHLARAFARRHSILDVLTQQVEFAKSMSCPEHETDIMSYNFVGSIPEIVAQWSWDDPKRFTLILDLVSEQGGTHFDLSTLLSVHIGRHRHTRYEGSCSLERLLDLGASANGPEEAFVTPLQVAVACWDLHGVETLLKAGAEPNAIGKEGLRWSPGSYMEFLNVIPGASALYLIRYFGCLYEDMDEDLRDDLHINESTREKIEKMLMEFGAVEIGPDDSDEGIDSEDFREVENNSDLHSSAE